MAHSIHHHRALMRRKQKRTFLTNLVLIMAIAEPMMTLPQAYEIWINKQTAGVSMATWSFAMLAATIWGLYAIHIKDKPLMASSILWILVEGSIVVGLIVIG